MGVRRKAIAPITDYADSYDELQLPYEFCNGVVFEEYPEWARPDENMKLLSVAESRHLRDARRAFTFAYDVEGIGASHPSSTDQLPVAWESFIHKQLCWTSLALWLTKPTSCAYERILFFADSGVGDSLQQAMKVSRLLHGPDEELSRLDMEDLQRANAILHVIQELDQENMLRTSLNLLFKALTERMWQARYAFYWIVLEALFGAEDAREIKFRLSQRAALFLGAGVDEQKKLFKEMQHGYDWRSKLVHGARLAKLTTKSAELCVSARKIIRLAFSKILPDKNVRSIFDGTGRDGFLDELAFKEALPRAQEGDHLGPTPVRA